MRISLINSVCRPRDAIGEVVYATYQAVASHPGWECRIFTYASEYPDIADRVSTLTSVRDMVTDPYFASSDVYLYHFGFFTELIQGLAVGRAGALRVARFHNVTPKALVPARLHPLIDKSLDQIALLDYADEIWADSPFNRRDLIDYGIPASKIIVEPLFGKPGFSFGSLRSKPRGCVNLLFVGRFVPSKGVLDLVKAISLLRKRTSTPFRLTLVGALTFSDADYIKEVRDTITCEKLEAFVDLAGELDESQLVRCFHDTHVVAVPSYHEGFCVPLVEAMHARAVPVGYAVGNIPDLIRDVGEAVTPGDIDALADVLLRLTNWFGRFWEMGDEIVPLSSGSVTMADYDEIVRSYVETYTLDAFQRRTVRRLVANTRPK